MMETHERVKDVEFVEDVDGLANFAGDLRGL
jgi:hypothetical protein